MAIERAAIYHRTDSEYAYLYHDKVVHIRLRTGKNNVKSVELVWGDPYLVHLSQYTQKSSMRLLASTAEHDYWQVEVTPEFHRLHYYFVLTGHHAECLAYTEMGFTAADSPLLAESSAYFKMPYLHVSDNFSAPEWVKETVWYQIFPERFANGNPTISPDNVKRWDATIAPKSNDFFGGDLQGIYDKLDYLQSLGVNGLYLCPIFEAATNHKYDTVDYYAIDRHFGDKALFKQLVDEAHARGMRIMLDAVFNHLGYHSPQWQDVVQNGDASRYADWFHINEFPVQSEGIRWDRDANPGSLNYETFAFAANLPKLRTTNPEVKRHLLEIATYWIREFKIDGWRLDVANEVDHQFWREFHQEVLAIKPDLYILGEIWHTSQSWLNGDEFHAVMNYAFTHHMKHYFLQKMTTPIELVERLNARQLLYRRQTNEVMFNLLDSHDTERILTTAQGDVNRVKAALTFMFLQMGVPCIYYGTEVGLIGKHDPDCRRVMPWDEAQQDRDLLKFVTALIHLRREYWRLFAEGSYRYNVMDEANKYLCLTVENHEHLCRAWFNSGKEEQTVNVNEATIILSNRYEASKLQADGLIITIEQK
ncbi:glycoside hydrolase family 13 protein [Aerococcaceae bacterium NML190073]|nr:glycoside hydrolase family 13 protein [Aerococcaceae bacterium NML190073]